MFVQVRLTRAAWVYLSSLLFERLISGVSRTKRCRWHPSRSKEAVTKVRQLPAPLLLLTASIKRLPSTSQLYSLCSTFNQIFTLVLCFEWTLMYWYNFTIIQISYTFPTPISRKFKFSYYVLLIAYIVVKNMESMEHEICDSI